MVRAQLYGQCKALLYYVHGDYFRTHCLGRQRPAGSHRALAEYHHDVPAGDLHLLESVPGGAGTTGDGRTLFERQLIVKEHQAP